MAKVRVYNDKLIEHVEKFKGDTFKIPAGGFIEMEDEDAVLFKSQFRTPIFDKGRNQTLESMKRIRVAPIPEQKGAVAKADESEPLRCMACNFIADSKAGLKSHVRAKHADAMVDDDARKELQKGA